ncbi:heat shock protein DnaJ domain protein [Sphingobium chlorophenolicum L-1]|uniref:Heat shock protein DnaJ domain protein n=1 Tax=Sphingobium chlorophenolicum L-1 TaxID=690566 RepID=F6EUV1_SPHCR|nr:DnaJ C-terminal domain-containing protein [Sphingobium chlorophenolicum]AEG49634.1 heat shock protein DnaJ domain protein [Sphingobium chlorophenolicum L-1]
MADPYSTLGVARGASEAEIKSAYRKLAKELHPDRNKDNPKAAEKFSSVTSAYDLLSDKDKRARFDRGEIDGDGNPTSPFGFGGGGGGGGFRGHPGGPGGGFEFNGGGADFGDIFEGLFGGAGRRGGGGFGRGAPPQKGANVTYRLAVQFIDAATLAPQRITLQDGKTIDLKLPAGVETGTQMRLSGKGQQGPGGAGDAIVTIEVRPHAFFTRDGDNVLLELPITLDEAVKGAKVKVPTVDGPVMLGVPAGTSSGKTLRLRGRGFTGKDGQRGDQLVTLMIDVPADDPAIKALVESWQDNRAVRTHLGV